MAHIGRDYEVHFRRDLCINCTNYRFAWPRNFLIGWNFTVATPTRVFSQLPATTQCALAGPNDGSVIEWRSGDVTQHGLTWQWRISDFGFTSDNTRTTLLVEALDGSTVVAAERVQNVTIGRCASYGALSGGPVSFDVGFWGGTHIGTFLGITTAGEPWP